MKKILLIILIILSALPLVSCKTESYAEQSYFKMDTIITLRLSSDTKSEVFDNAESLIAEYENIFSKTVPESDISLFNESDTGCEISPECADVIQTALDIAKETNGAYDITVGNLVTLWDIPNGNRVPDKNEIFCALQNVGYGKISLNGNTLTKETPDLTIDLGGIAKGCALGKTVELLTESGVEYGIVSFGGNIGLIGKKPDGESWRVSIKSPYEGEADIGYMTLDTGFVAVSGDYERYFELDGIRYHHILDTETGYPVKNGVHSVAIWSKNATEADALSTALFSLGYEKAVELYNENKFEFEALFVTDDGIKMTNGMQKIFTETK